MEPGGLHGHNVALGRHMTVEYYDCDPKILSDPVRVEAIFLEAAKAGGATILGHNFHSFEPQGVSGFVIIAESHISVHTWPEHDYAAVDIFTCGAAIDFKKAVDSLKDGLHSEHSVISSIMNRGIVNNNGVERLVPVCEDRTHIYSLSWQDSYDRSKAWGLLASVDVYECNPATIRDAAKIRLFVQALSKKIGMKCFGDCVIVNFGKEEREEGFSMTQLIETSLISGHFANVTNTAYIDIFSCRFFDPRESAEFAADFFQGKHYRMQVALRR